VRDAGGIAFADGAVVPGVAALAFGLPEQVGLRPLVLSVGGPAERVLAERMSIEAALRREAEALCGPAARVGGRRATRSDAPTARRARLPRSTRLRRR
jgi:hypothetical protein